jgi:hypothetical protein
MQWFLQIVCLTIVRIYLGLRNGVKREAASVQRIFA